MGSAVEDHRVPHLCLSFWSEKRPFENDIDMFTLYSEELKIGSGYMSSVDANETVSNFPVKIRYLVDSGAQLAFLSQHVASDEQFHCWRKEIPELLLGFTGRFMAGTEKTCIRIHVRGDVFPIIVSLIDIVDIVGDRNVTIPESYVMRYRQNLWLREIKRLANQSSRWRKHHRSNLKGTLRENST